MVFFAAYAGYASWAFGETDYNPRDQAWDRVQQTRQQAAEQRRLMEERRLELQTPRADFYPRDQDQERRWQLRQQVIEQKRLNLERSQEQSLNRRDAFPKDRLLDFRQQLRQQQQDQLGLSKERRRETLSNPPVPPVIEKRPPPSVDRQLDAPR